MPNSREQKARRARRDKRLASERAKILGLDKAPAKGSKLEKRFADRWEILDFGIPLEREYLPVPGRRYRLDFAHPETKVGVEINGGTWSRRKGGHSSGAGIQSNYEKINLCQMNGWVVFQLDSEMIDGRKLKSGFSSDYWQLAIADLIKSREESSRVHQT